MPSSARARRTWELLSVLALLLVMGGLAGAYLRHRADNLELARTFDTGDPGRARRLLQRGANPRVRGESGATLLILAAKYNDVELLREGLARGLDVNAVDHHHLTPLMWAAGNGWTESTEVLLAAGADASLRTREGYTALTFAAATGKKVKVSASAGRSSVIFARPARHPRLVKVSRLLQARAAR